MMMMKSSSMPTRPCTGSLVMRPTGPRLLSQAPSLRRSSSVDGQRRGVLMRASGKVGVISTGLDVENELKNKSLSSCVIIFLTADWCGPCSLVCKELIKLESQPRFKHVKIMTVNTDAEKEWATKIGVSALPTLMFVGSAPAESPALMTQGLVSLPLLADIIDSKLKYAGGNLQKPRRL